MKRGRHKPISFFLVNLRNIASCNPFVAAGAKYRAMTLRKINRTINNAVVVHFDKIAFADFLIVGDKSLAPGAAYD